MALSDHDDDFDKPVTTDQYGKAKLDSIPDGDYKCEIASCRIKDELDLVAIDLEIISDGKASGAKVERAYFLTEKVKDAAGNIVMGTNAEGKAVPSRIISDRNRGELYADLEAIGLDPKEWKKANGRPFSVELTKAAKAIVGVRVYATKSSRKGDSRTFHSLKFTKRVEGEDGKPMTFTAADLTEAAADPFDVAEEPIPA